MEQKMSVSTNSPTTGGAHPAAHQALFPEALLHLDQHPGVQGLPAARMPSSDASTICHTGPRVRLEGGLLAVYPTRREAG